MIIEINAPIGSYSDQNTDMEFYGISLDYLLYRLAQIEPGEEVELRINCWGGVLQDAISFVQRLRLLSAEGHTIRGVVLGAAYSAGAVLLLGCDVVEVAIGSLIMIHDPMGGAWGTAADLQHAANWLDREAFNLAELFAARMSIEPEAARTLLLAETLYTAEEAVAAGLANKLLETTAIKPLDAMAILNFYRTPKEQLLTMSKSPKPVEPNPTTPAVPAVVNAQTPAVESQPVTPAAQPTAAPVVSVNVSDLATLANSLSEAVKSIGDLVSQLKPAPPAAPTEPAIPAAVNVVPVQPLTLEAFADEMRQANQVLTASINHIRSTSVNAVSGGEPGTPQRKPLFTRKGLQPSKN